MNSALIRNVELAGQGQVDVSVIEGSIHQIGPRLQARAALEIDGRGGALLPGLWDHHIHLFGLAAAMESVDVSPAAVGDADGFAKALRTAAKAAASGAWLRAVGYDDAVAGPLERDTLDRLVADRPLRVQYRTGSLWALNSEAVRRLGPGPFPPGVQQSDGRLTGLVLREDGWLREQLGSVPPSLATVSRMLSRWGVTGVTDASATNDSTSAAAIARARRSGELRQRVILMSARPLEPSADDAFDVGPWKIVLDDAHLPDPRQPAELIRDAHASGRAVGIHCVTAGELAVALAAFAEGGVIPGDRIEHGGVIDADATSVIAELGLTVVTQPVFVADRGDRYIAEVDPGDQAALYPAASLLAAGVRVAGSSDAPYGSADPWKGMRAAVSRLTAAGQALNLAERVSPARALGLWLGHPNDPGGRSRKVEVGAPADLCLMKAPLAEALDALSGELVAATLVGGDLTFG